jgi:sugar O-acyltransferase (sialic acid O-acetyltransferase NeuD family)
MRVSFSTDRLDNRTLIFVGAGDHALVLLDLLEREKHANTLLGVVAPDKTFSWEGYPVLGTDEALPELVSHYGEKASFVLALGDTALRYKVLLNLLSLGATLANVVSKTAIVSPRAQLEPGCQILTRAIVHPKARVGMGAIINTNATIEHHVQIAEGCHVAPNATVAGRVNVGKRCWIGMGALVRQGLSIADDTVVGAGAVVVKPITIQGQTVVGCPAVAVS